MISLEDDDPELTRHTLCQLCGYIPENVEREPFKKWRVYSYNTLVGISVHVVACPDCTEVHPMEALSIYQKRVSAGLDINFH